MPSTVRPVLEITCWLVGLVTVGLYFVAVAHGEVERKAAIAAFTGAYAAPDRSDWSQERIAAFQAAEASESLPVALLRIPRVALEVPVYADITERDLNRGAGLIEGTALPGSDGNVGVAAHRDGYFRVLNEVLVGDVIELVSPGQRDIYRVSELSIVEPTDTRSLNATSSPSITLVTCYPFYFVGSAPQRYIVRAVSQSEIEVKR